MTEPAAATDHEPDEPEYRGAATLLAGDAEVAVTVQVRGNFQPIDGRFHWYGRVAAADQVDEFAARHRKNVILRTEHGEAAGTLSDRDTWGRYRIDGVGQPPFRIDEPDASTD